MPRHMLVERTYWSVVIETVKAIHKSYFAGQKLEENGYSGSIDNNDCNILFNLKATTALIEDRITLSFF